MAHEKSSRWRISSANPIQKTPQPLLKAPQVWPPSMPEPYLSKGFSLPGILIRVLGRYGEPRPGLGNTKEHWGA